MYKRIIITISCFLCLGILMSCQTQPEMTAMQKRQITMKLINGSYTNVFSATMMIIQDNGYVIKQATKDTGLITAEVSKDTLGSNNSSVVNALLDVFSSSSNDKDNRNNGPKHSGTKRELSAMVSQISKEASEIRFSIQEKDYNDQGGITHSKKVLDPKHFKKLFHEITIEVKRREAFGRE